MPGLLVTPETEFKTLKIKKLHPTFAAEIEGVDFSRPIPDDVFREILAASAKVLPMQPIVFTMRLASVVVTA